MTTWRIIEGDCRHRLAEFDAGSVQTCVTSPPYFGLRDYGTGEWEGGDAGCDHQRQSDVSRSSSGLGVKNGRGPYGDQFAATQGGAIAYRNECGKCGARRVDKQIGLEPTPDEFVAALVSVFREVRRVLRDDGTIWLNLASSYASTDTRPSRSRQPQRVPACGTDGTESPDSPAPGSACPDLCDGCRAATQNHHGHSGCTDRPLELAEQPDGQTVRDTAPRGSGSASLDASPRDARGSTTSLSAQQPRGECSHCANCGACLDVLRSSSRDARLCARTAECSNGTSSLALDGRNPDTDAGGMAWVNYTRRLKPKDMIPTPWMVAMALQADGWYLRSDIIWSKANPMPESVTDRPTKAHEYLFLLSKAPRYWYDAEAIRESAQDWGSRDRSGPLYDGSVGPQTGHTGLRDLNHAETGRNKRSVWTVATQPYPGAHFATFPPKLIEPCILAGCPERACGECGAPWTRVVEREDAPAAPKRPKDYHATMQTGGVESSRLSISTSAPVPMTRTVGWEPTCDHNAPSAPGTVLDPFAGAGTTGMVALRHGRSFVGIELSPEYARLARERIIADAPLFNQAAEVAA